MIKETNIDSAKVLAIRKDLGELLKDKRTMDK